MPCPEKKRQGEDLQPGAVVFLRGPNAKNVRKKLEQKFHQFNEANKDDQRHIPSDDKPVKQVNTYHLAPDSLYRSAASAFDPDGVKREANNPKQLTFADLYPNARNRMRNVGDMALQLAVGVGDGAPNDVSLRSKPVVFIEIEDDPWGSQTRTILDSLRDKGIWNPKKDEEKNEVKDKLKPDYATPLQFPFRILSFDLPATEGAEPFGINTPGDLARFAAAYAPANRQVHPRPSHAFDFDLDAALANIKGQVGDGAARCFAKKVFGQEGGTFPVVARLTSGFTETDPEVIFQTVKGKIETVKPDLKDPAPGVTDLVDFYLKGVNIPSMTVCDKCIQKIKNTEYTWASRIDSPVLPWAKHAPNMVDVKEYTNDLKDSGNYDLCSECLDMAAAALNLSDFEHNDRSGNTEHLAVWKLSDGKWTEETCAPKGGEWEKYGVFTYPTDSGKLERVLARRQGGNREEFRILVCKKFTPEAEKGRWMSWDGTHNSTALIQLSEADPSEPRTRHDYGYGTTAPALGGEEDSAPRPMQVLSSAPQDLSSTAQDLSFTPQDRSSLSKWWTKSVVRRNIIDMEEEHTKAKAEWLGDNREEGEKTWKEHLEKNPTPLYRYYQALRIMMQNAGWEEDEEGVRVAKPSPATSEYTRLVGYHPNFCSHGVESFGVWHKAYMAEFELALRTADYSLGRDGNVGIAYWDWFENLNPESMNQFTFHERLGDGDFDAGAAPLDANQSRYHWTDDEGVSLAPYNLSYLFRGQKSTPRDGCLQRDNFRFTGGEFTHVAESLYERCHFNFISTGSRRPHCLEAPHNLVHNNLGNPMGNVYYSVWDPVFWFHHGNVDKWFQTYINIRGPNAVQTSYSEHQEQEMQNRIDLGDIAGGRQINNYKWNSVLNPFAIPITHPEAGRDFQTVDTLVPPTTAFGYSYDKLYGPPVVARRHEAKMTTVSLPNQKKIRETSGVRVTAWILPSVYRNIAPFTKWSVDPKPDKDTNQVTEPFYAGEFVCFHKGEEGCSTCRDFPTYDIVIDIADALRNHWVDSRAIRVKLMAEVEEVVDGKRTTIRKTLRQAGFDLTQCSAYQTALKLQPGVANDKLLQAFDTDGEEGRQPGNPDQMKGFDVSGPLFDPTKDLVTVGDEVPIWCGRLWDYMRRYGWLERSHKWETYEAAELQQGLGHPKLKKQLVELSTAVRRLKAFLNTQEMLGPAPEGSIPKNPFLGLTKLTRTAINVVRYDGSSDHATLETGAWNEIKKMEEKVFTYYLPDWATPNSMTCRDTGHSVAWAFQQWTEAAVAEGLPPLKFSRVTGKGQEKGADIRIRFWNRRQLSILDSQPEEASEDPKKKPAQGEEPFWTDNELMEIKVEGGQTIFTFDNDKDWVGRADHHPLPSEFFLEGALLHAIGRFLELPHAPHSSGPQDETPTDAQTLRSLEPPVMHPYYRHSIATANKPITWADQQSLKARADKL